MVVMEVGGGGADRRANARARRLNFQLMSKGNLRDFLRAHRLDADEDGRRYSKLPTAAQYFVWAAQIAGE